MKKISFFVIFIPIFFLLASCGTTANVAQPSESPAETVSRTQEDVANAIADEMNAVSAKNTDDDAADTNSPENESNDTDELGSVTENDFSENDGIFLEPSVQIPDEESAESAHNEESRDETENDSLSNDTENEEFQNESAEDTRQADSEPEISEKVSDEDSHFEKERENAPTTDERGKVFEYPIFEEPEVVVLDLPEEETQTEEITAVPEEPNGNSIGDTAVIAERAENLAATETEKNDETPAPKTEIPAKEAISRLPENESAETKNEAPAPQEAEKTTETTESSGTEEKSDEEKAEIVPSRSVAVKITQFLDVTYPGKGWTYIGEPDKKNDKNGLFTYSGRKLGSNNTTFSLRAKKAGNTILHFYKNDALTGEYIDDYLSVTVENKRSAGRVKAPAYADIVPAQPQRRIDRANETAQNQTAQAAGSGQNQNTPKTAENSDSAKRAKNTTEKAVPQSSAPEKESSSEKAQESVTQNQASASSQTSQNQMAKEINTQTTAEQWNAQSQKTVNTSSTNAESDIKTIIQTTDEANKTQNQGDSAVSRTSLSSRDQPAPEIPQERENEQSFSYTPISSESIQTIPLREENTVQREPTVIAPSREAVSAKNEVDESLLEKAKQDFVDGKFEDALKEAQEYYNNADTRLDEALFLLGQISESNSSVKNIRFAVDSYDMLVKRFPASRLWKDAKNRSIYLKRFYIDIR